MGTSRIWILAGRVVNQLRADPRTMALMFFVPILLLSFLGILIRADNAELKVAVVNHDAGAGPVNLGDELIAVLQSFDEFETVLMAAGEAESQLEGGDIDAAITIPADFSQQIAISRELMMDVRYEGSNPMLSDRLEKIFERAALQAAVRAASRGGASDGSPAADAASSGVPEFDTTIHATYLHAGPEYDTLDYMAPALIGFFVFFFVFILTCISFLRERVAGTLERLQATPIRAHEIIVGYMGGFLVFGLAQGVVVLLFTLFVLDIHYAGNLLNIFVVEALLVALSVNVGILLSTFAQNEFQVMQFIPLIVVSQGLLGGVIWEIEDMPGWLQSIANAMPLTYSNRALRDVMVKGESLLAVADSLLVVLAFVVAAILLSARTAGRTKI
jgi:ABC-2 type transport system permease protein